MEEYEKLYPGYFLAEACAWHNDVYRGTYIIACFYRKDAAFHKSPKRRRAAARSG